MKIELDSCTEAPWDRGRWNGRLVSIDGCDAADFTREDVDMVIAYGDTGEGAWTGTAAGIALLKDGRFVAWESTWDATGSGFHEDAYGGDADIAFARTIEAAISHISEQAREPLKVRFVRILRPDPSGEPGGRIRVEYDPDHGLAVIADEDVLPERIDDPDARNVSTLANLSLTTEIATWLSDVLRELVPVMQAEDDRTMARMAVMS